MAKEKGPAFPVKLQYIGESRATFPSAPAGLTLTWKAGEEKEVDAGFAYLLDDPRFRVVEPPAAPDAPAPPAS